MLSNTIFLSAFAIWIITILLGILLRNASTSSLAEFEEAEEIIEQSEGIVTVLKTCFTHLPIPSLTILLTILKYTGCPKKCPQFELFENGDIFSGTPCTI